MGRDRGVGSAPGCHTRRMTGWRRWSWAGVWLFGVLLTSPGATQPRLAIAALGGLLAGVVWQVVARKDPATRLVVLALGGVLTVVMEGVVPALGVPTDAEADVGLYLLGVASAVVLTEQVLRRRDLGPVTRDMVHAPEDDAAARRPG